MNERTRVWIEFVKMVWQKDMELLLHGQVASDGQRVSVSAAEEADALLAEYDKRAGLLLSGQKIGE